VASLMSAVVELKPDVAKFQKEATKGVEKATKDAGAKMEKGLGDAGGKAGKKAGTELGKGLEKGAGDGAKKAGDKVEREMEKAGKASASKFSGAFDKMNSVGNKMTVGITLPAILAAKTAYTAFADFQDASAAAGQFYGEQSKAIEAFGATADKAYGMSRQGVLALANGMAPLVGQFTAVNERGEVAIDVIKRAGDMSSFFGGSAEEAAGAIQSFLSGSSVEPIRRYGVFASEAAVQAKALEMGLVKSEVSTGKLTQAQIRLKDAQTKAADAAKQYGAGSDQATKATADAQVAEEALATLMEGKVPQMDEATKIQARYALMMEQTAVAEGDFGRNAEGAANVMKSNTAVMQNAAITLGEKLAPTITKVIQGVTALVEKFSKLPEPVQNALVVFAGIAAVAGPLLKVITLAKSMWGVLAGLAARWFGVASAANTAAVAQQRAAAAGGMGGMGKMLGRGAAVVGGGLLAYNGFRGATGDGNTSWGDAAGLIGGGAAAGWGIGGPVGALIGGAAGAGAAVGTKLAHMADGGTVAQPGWSWVGEKGPELMMMPKGATVVPNRESVALAGAGGSTVTNISMSVRVDGKGFDERTLAAHLDAIARRAAATNTRTARAVR
jgi:hypothetical protein